MVECRSWGGGTAQYAVKQEQPFEPYGAAEGLRHRGNAEALTVPDWPRCGYKCHELSGIPSTK